MLQRKHGIVSEYKKKKTVKQRVPNVNQPPRDKLPAEVQRLRTWGLSQVKYYAAYANPF